jgi:hypothetical protein
MVGKQKPEMKTETLDGRFVFVLGTSHHLQMAERRAARENNVADPLYTELIKHFLRPTCLGDAVDAIFEEASGCGPTAAEKLAKELGLAYRDVDPHPNERYLHNLSPETGEPLAPPFDLVVRVSHEQHSKREDLWVTKIGQEEFRAAVVICGFLHTLTLSEKLTNAGFVVYAYVYVPHDKLCRRMHPS